MRLYVVLARPRVGEHRLLLWPDTSQKGDTTYVVARVIDRRDLLRVIRTLTPPEMGRRNGNGHRPSGGAKVPTA